MSIAVPNCKSYIRFAEFAKALLASWRPECLQDAGRHQSIGIAVSGGVDSMALATLCRQLNTMPVNCEAKAINDYIFQFRALVVDHRAREGSSVEAKVTSEHLKMLGLQSEILTIEWPADVQPAQLSDFESQARHLRYQALGKACLANSISSLLLAHHEDDQAETVLMRLAKGCLGTPLRGMQASAKIPECWGMYGVHESGDRASAAAIRAVHRPELGAVQSTAAEKSLGGTVEAENGGIRVHRPLLRFSKSRLEATCEHFGTKWVEDLTNRDPTITMRNSVRGLLHDQRLPTALRKGSLLCLAERALQRSTERASNMRRFVQQHCTILKFDLRSGLLVIQLLESGAPNISHLPIYDQEESSRRELYQKRLLVHHLIKLVTPQEDVPLQDLRTSVSMLFPESTDLGTRQGKGNYKVKNTTTVGKAWLQCLSGTPYISNMQSRSTKPFNGDLSKDRGIWMLSRQPHDARENLPTIVFPPNQSSNFNREVVDTAAATRNNEQSFSWSGWQLWDGRYWIRLLNCTKEEVEVRPMQEYDLTKFRTQLTSTRQAIFNKKLRDAVPDRIRWTLPVIALKGGPVRAVPTLQEVVDDEALNLKWEIRYKEVDLTPWSSAVVDKALSSTISNSWE